MDYTLTQKEFSNLKRRLTIAKKKGPAAIVAECKHAFAIFQDKGYPDSWSTWQRAQDDAENELRRTFVRISSFGTSGETMDGRKRLISEILACCQANDISLPGEALFSLAFMGLPQLVALCQELHIDTRKPAK